MRINSNSSQFVFNLPTDFLPKEIIEDYQCLLEKNWVQYENVIDYLNSSIKEISFPGFSIEAPSQIRKRGKEINYKPATNVQDIVSSRQIDITFREMDSGLNYWLLGDIFVKHYMDTEHAKYIAPFTITALDINRDAIYRIVFREIIMLTQSEQRFSYSDQAFSERTFTLTFNFNWYDIDFLLKDKKVLSTENIEPVIQVLPSNIDDYKPNPIKKFSLNNENPNQDFRTDEQKQTDYYKRRW